MNLRTLTLGILSFVAVGMVIIVGLEVMTDAQVSMVEDSSAYNGTKQIVIGTQKLPGILPILGTVLALGVLLSMIMLLRNPPVLFDR